MIHTCADPTLSDSIKFSPDAISSGIRALRQGRAIYADSNMIRAGLSLTRLRSANHGYRKEDILCHVADSEVAAQAAANGLPRSLFALRQAAVSVLGGISVFGNAPG